MKKILISLLLLVGVGVSGQEPKINTKLPIPGATLANMKLQYDTLIPVYRVASLKVANCNNLSVINSKVLKQPSNNNWKEEWVVNACGKNVFVPIIFTLDTYGATYMISPKDVHF